VINECLWVGPDEEHSYQELNLFFGDK